MTELIKLRSTVSHVIQNSNADQKRFTIGNGQFKVIIPKIYAQPHKEILDTKLKLPILLNLEVE